MRKEREKIYIYGKHALEEGLLNAPHVIKKVFLSAEINDGKLREVLTRLNIPIATIKDREASRMVGKNTAHQGVIAVADQAGMMVDFKNFMADLQPTAETMLVLLDELTDPHNVGAIIRSAAAFGAAGVLIPYHNQAPITGAVVKASAGMVFRVPLVSLGNINYTIDKLKEKGFRAYALAANGKQSVTDESFDTPTLFIVGNESHGIREKTIERCDADLRIQINPRSESLNASVSAAIVLYAWSTKHPENLKNV